MDAVTKLFPLDTLGARFRGTLRGLFAPAGELLFVLLVALVRPA